MLSKEYPVHAIAAVGCVVIKNNEILLVKRKYPPAEKHWAIPGGVIEPNESVYEAAIRELEEETGLRAKPIGIIGVADVIFRDKDRVRYRYVIIEILFDPSTVEGSIKPGEEVLDIKWMNIYDIISRSDVTRSTRKLVENIIKQEYSLIKTIQVVIEQ